MCAGIECECHHDDGADKQSFHFSFYKIDNMKYRCVRYKDGDSMNYNITNLQWSNPCTKKQWYNGCRSDKDLSDKIIKYKSVPNIDIMIDDIECEVLKVNDRFAISKSLFPVPYLPNIPPQHQIFTLSGKPIPIFLGKDSYLSIVIGFEKFLHIVVAAQWSNNDDPINKIIVDHIDGDIYNNTKENLRYVIWDVNNKNLHFHNSQRLELFTTLPPGTKRIVSYKNNTFENIYYNKQLSTAYYFNETFYQKKHIEESSKGEFIKSRNIFGKERRIYINECQTIDI